MNKKQSGFSAIEAIIIVVVIAVLGFGGWFVWSKKHNDTDNKQTSAQTQTTPQKVEEKTTPTLKISEWNVTLTLSGTIEDAYYYVKKDEPNYAYLSVHSLTDPDCAPNKIGVGAI